MAATAVDFTVQNEGNIFLLHPETDAAREWVEDNVVQNDETLYFGRAIVVEHRYIGDIVSGIQADGLSVA